MSKIGNKLIEEMELTGKTTAEIIAEKDPGYEAPEI